MQNIDLEGIFSNFEEIKMKYMDSLRSVIHSMDHQTKIDIHQWLTDIKAIKENQELTAAQKESKLSKVKTSETVLTFIKSFIEVLLHKLPIQNKGILSSGLAGVAMAASMLRLNARVAIIALLVLRKALPKFIMSSKFDEFAAFIERELPIGETDTTGFTAESVPPNSVEAAAD